MSTHNESNKVQTIACLNTPETAIFTMDGYHLWDPSVIQVGDTFHLFTSRWASDDSEDRDFKAWKTSHAIRATSSDLYGPYEFQEVVLEPRTDQWDSEAIHNPKIMKVGNRYLLYYLGLPQYHTGFAWADTIEGPFIRGEQSALKLNNPAFWVHDDGSVYCVGKVRSPLLDTEVRPWTNWMIAYKAPSLDGPYEVVGDPMTNRLPNDYELEDPTLWWDGTHYHVILTDWKGKVTGARTGLHYKSKNGIDYELVSPKPVFDHKIQTDKRTISPLNRNERPQIVLDDANKPIALCTAYLEPKGLAGVAITPVEEALI